MTLRPVPARWFELLTTREELAPVLAALAHSGAVELETFSRPSETLFAPAVQDALAAYSELEKRYQAYWPEPASTPLDQIGAPETLLSEGLGALERWRQAADPLIEELEQSRRRVRRLERLHLLLTDCTEALPNLVRLGRCGPELVARLFILPEQVTALSLPELLLHKRFRRPGGDYLLILGGARDVAAQEDQLYAMKAKTVPIPDDLPAGAPEAAEDVAARLNRLRGVVEDAESKLKALSALHDVAQVRARIGLIAWLASHAGKLSATPRLTSVTGWTTASDESSFCEPLRRAGLRCLVRFPNAPEGAEPPSVLRNPRWVRGFETLTTLLGSPGRNEADPSQILAVFAPVLFGFMFGDVGQGAVLCAGGLALRRRLPVLGLMIPGGIMAIAFGALYGEVFTREDLIAPLWLRPLEAPMTVLGSALGLGVLILLTGLILNGAEAHWRGAGGAWWLRDFSLLAAYLAIISGIFWPPAFWLAAFCALWFVAGEVLLDRASPLAAAIRGTAHLTETGLRLAVNTVSFARVGAFALAHAGLSIAVADVAGAAGGAGYWIVLILGNAFIILLEGMIVAIQTTRLLLFEFFVRFLEGTGRGFRPLRPPAPASPSAKGERA
jgi:V/A-type H+-transporting ATPase subunit I